MTISYNINIPNGPNSPSADQPLMQSNTNAINQLINVDHYSFRTSSSTPGANSGTHKQVSLKNESAPGIPSGSNGVLFANLANGQSYPFWQNGAGTFPLFGQNSIAANGYTTLPGGVIFQWGSIIGAPISNGASVTFPLTFPGSLFSITLGPASNSTNDKTISITTGSQSTSGFTVKTSGSSLFQTLYWMAIGN